MNLGISVVSFNRQDLLSKCLSSITEKKWKTKVKIWVVDNASLDGSFEMVKERFPQVNLILAKENFGFAKGQNLALKKINESYLLILNPDTEVLAGSLDKMVDFMEGNPECGISSCRIVDFSDRLQPNAGDLPLGFSLINWLFNLEFIKNLPNFHRVEDEYYKDIREVGWVSGSFMMVRKNVFEKIGFFDEKYFMYFEDVDLCFRAKNEGFKIMLNPEVTIRHVGGASSKDPSLSQWRGEFKGLVIFYKLKFGVLAGLFVKILIYISILLRMMAFGLIGKFGVFKTYGKILFST